MITTLNRKHQNFEIQFKYVSSFTITYTFCSAFNTFTINILTKILKNKTFWIQKTSKNEINHDYHVKLFYEVCLIHNACKHIAANMHCRLILTFAYFKKHFTLQYNNDLTKVSQKYIFLVLIAKTKSISFFLH